MIDHHTLYIKLKRKMIKSDIKKGDIYYATLNPAIGSEQKGERPVVFKMIVAINIVRLL